MKFGILRFPGSCDEVDALQAARRVGDAELLWHADRDLKGADAIVVPGGFSYGDYLRAGAIARFAPVMESVISFAKEGRLVLGICNGFQVLCEANLLPGALLPNLNRRFTFRQVDLEVVNEETPFTRAYVALGEDLEAAGEGPIGGGPGARGEGPIGGSIGVSENAPPRARVALSNGTTHLSIPAKHSWGRYYASEETLQEMERSGQVVLRYAEGENFNGSLSDIAGVCNREGNVFGLMPHPEHAVDELSGSTDGLVIFESMRLSLEGNRA